MLGRTVTGDAEFFGIDLTADRYVVKKSVVRDRCQVYNEDGKLLLETTNPTFRVETGLIFVDGDGNEVFKIESGNLPEDYFITPADRERPALIIEEDLETFQRRWKIRDRNERLLAVIETRGKFVEFFRVYVPLGGVLPHSYAVESADGTEVAAFSGSPGISRTYTLEIGNAGALAREVLAAGALAVEILDEQ
jgi:uncharacterized protein YxjI